ncbi:MAG TPA: S8 family serine peptidase [Trebonia sp.]|nr:S8 family serine peptidase [Trebonia sp.]
MLAGRRALLAAAATVASMLLASVLLAPAARAVPATPSGPAGITVPAPPSEVNQIRTAEMPALNEIDVPAAWRVTKGKNVLVAVLDTGVDQTVPDLAGQVTVGPNYLPGVDPPGYQPPLEHGTYIASLIAGHGRGPGDSMGIIGVAPQARILSVRVIPDDSEPGLATYNDKSRYASALADGIRYAVNNGANVINMSLGGQQATASLRAAIAYAISHGVVVVASAGNSGTSQAFAPYDYPAAFTGVIGVAALNPDGARAPFSQQNSSVVIAAPGVDVVGAGPGGEYIDAAGTSPAAAFVSGVAALILSEYPGLPPALVEQAIISSASHQPAGGYSVDVGFGEVDALAALSSAATLAIASHQASHPQGASMASPRVALARSPAPIMVTHRDRTLIMAWVIVSTVAAVLAAVALATLVVSLRRPRSRRPGPQMASMPPGDDLIGLQQPAQPEQVLDARLDLHLARHPGPGDVHRLLGQQDDLVARRGQPHVRLGLIRPGQPHQVVTVTQHCHEGHTEVGYRDADGPVAEVLLPLLRGQLRQPPG